jgi:deoxyribodipyrimidine photo-lyase
VSFIYDELEKIHQQLKKQNSGLLILKGDPLAIWKKIISDYQVKTVFTNHDYEPYAIKRDSKIEQLLSEKNISFHSYKDQVIFEKDEILTNEGKPYTVYTPYKNKWLETLKKKTNALKEHNPKGDFYNVQANFPSRENLGFKKSDWAVKPFQFDTLDAYADTRDYPDKDNGSYLSPHLRFGTVSIHNMVKKAQQFKDGVFLSELIWREFFMQILFHFPDVVEHNFRRKYDGVQWRNNEQEFEKWKQGKTGYPLVDAGMRQLNKTGYMHNRVRMVTASFLCKHLLIDWRWGEAYFAKMLFDYELASNNGNWQWAAGTGCDAAPYFRVFNPTSQVKKYDPDLKYIRKWVEEYDTLEYPAPMVEHSAARQRALDAYKEGLN